MNEAARKPAQTAPESYNPKKPELLNMAKQIQSNPFKPISDFSGENGIYEMPPARFIGIRHNHMPGTKGRKQLGDFIDSTFQSKTWKDVVMNLPNVLCGEAGDFTCEYVPETDSFSFIVGVFAPAGTPVPEGLDSRDVPATLVWVSKKEGGKGKDIPDGYETNFDAPGFPWQAFLRADTYAILPIKDIFTAARPAPASNSPLGARRAPDACPAP
ncbi:MAG TPA: GyrI-like domain-containing protein [Clostridia bacterium]|nr:GyrI-like domain-containing protein [Clostridia bacterium]